MSGSLGLAAFLAVDQKTSENTEAAGEEPLLLRNSHASQQRESGEKEADIKRPLLVARHKCCYKLCCVRCSRGNLTEAIKTTDQSNRTQIQASLNRVLAV